MAPNLGWVDVPLGARLARALAVAVPIAIANDADAGILAEHRRGAAVGVDDALFVSGEVGIGGGVIVGGRPLIGTAGFARRDRPHDGQPGRDRLPLRRPSAAGRPRSARGCCSRRPAIRRTPGGPGSTACSSMPPPDRRSRWPRSGYVGRWLGIGLGSLVNIFNPRIIVLGGPHGRIHPFVRDILEAELAAHSLPAPRAQVRVVPAALGIDAPLVGASELAFEPLLADPAAWFQRPGGTYHLASA